jgi:hypothetical protein
MFGPLADLTLEIAASQVAARRFDFGRDSAVARHLIQRTLAAISDDERGHGIYRVAPFTLKLDVAGHTLPVSLLDTDLTSRLLAGEPLGQALRSRRDALFKELLQREPALTMDQVRRIMAPTEILAAGGRLPRRADVATTGDPHSCRMDLAQLRTTLAVPDTLLPSPEELIPAPASVLAKVGPAIEKEGRSPEMARSFISHMVALRQRFCPRFDELQPGQLVAVALDVSDRRMSLKTRYRAHVPVRLTLYTEAELAALEQLGPWDRQRLDDILGRRVARLLTEAYCQGGLLSLTLVGLLTHQRPGRVSNLVNQFEAACGLVLPTPGSIHDAGSKLTHKAAIVRLHLAGMDCKRIARETFHCEEAVGRYVDDFERVLIACAHGLPSSLLPRLLKLGPHVVSQYQDLISRHIGAADDVRALLHSRGVGVEERTA